MLELTRTQGARRTYEAEGERGRLVVDIATARHDRTCKHDLMHAYVKEGHLPEFMDTTLHVDTYFYDEEGRCLGWYNPTMRMHEGGTRMVIDFDWKLEATPENEARLLAEIERMMLTDERVKPARQEA